MVCALFFTHSVHISDFNRPFYSVLYLIIHCVPQSFLLELSFFATACHYRYDRLTQMVKEFGNNSPYKSSFEDPNHYLLELVQLVEAKQPILAAERNASGLGPANAPEGSSSKVAGANGDGSNGSTKQQPKSALSVFPLEVPADESDPKRRGAMPLCSYNSVRFKTAALCARRGVRGELPARGAGGRAGDVPYPLHQDRGQGGQQPGPGVILSGLAALHCRQHEPHPILAAHARALRSHPRLQRVSGPHQE